MNINQEQIIFAKEIIKNGGFCGIKCNKCPLFKDGECSSQNHSLMDSGEVRSYRVANFQKIIRTK